MSEPSKIANSLGHLRAILYIRAWKQSAGPVLLKQAEFFGVRTTAEGLCLQLNVGDSLWRQELEFSKKDILERFNAALLKLGGTRAEMPQTCSLHFGTAVPFKAGYPQKGRNK